MVARRFVPALLVCVAGCASPGYQYGQGWARPLPGDEFAESRPDLSGAVPRESGVVVAEGRPHRFVDGLGWVVGIPGKVVLWDRRVNNHDVSCDTTDAVEAYLVANQIPDVCVRVNQYAPAAEWRRLRQNVHVAPGWRYTVGALSWLEYTLLPGRVFGGDRYNPYTNSLYVYSDAPPLALQAAAYAKDVHQRPYPGTYAVVNELPVVTLWHETLATGDALAYVEEAGDADAQHEAVRILYPYYGVQVGSGVESIVSGAPLFEIGGALVGHAAARYETRRTAPVQQTAAVELPAGPRE